MVHQSAMKDSENIPHIHSQHMMHVKLADVRSVKKKKKMRACVFFDFTLWACEEIW